VKRGFDIIFSFIGLIILIPLFMIITLLIKLLMPGPVLFSQKRTGLYGKPFSLYKFRSMTVNHGGNSTTVKGDNRITPFGAKLRKYKLDELPELWNVLKGDMSFVGPRPDMPEYTDRLLGKELRILDLRPGITGPASLLYSNEEEILASVPDPQNYTDTVIWPNKVRINLEYYHNRSFFGDMLIIARTFFMIINKYRKLFRGK
jgi:lipopolysaccharide/colanic/teichoic acid biosynthesis glycosyltransferase